MNDFVSSRWLFTGLLLFGSLLPAAVMAQEQAADKPASPLDKRMRIERETRYQPFVLTPHKPNYLLPLTYNSNPNQAPFDPQQDGTIEEPEVKFQISIKMPVTDEIFGDRVTLYAAYTNQSYWQAYNDDNSHPFRETNHEPELFLAIQNDWQWAGFTNRLIFLGISHQSNGQNGDKSRSWNRLYADFMFERGDFYLSFKPWLRLEVPDAEDDNPDIEDYMGHGELRLVYASGDHTVGLRLRNNLQSDNRGAVELNWSFPMSRRAKWFIQYFDGYGESLIDYNARVKRLGIGIALTDWL
ncbi:phospholipase A [Thiohalophilus sp.]|uniref:phospholipase A n=1 Tax=Thiohalophilus sp. TaxID=3028392 RepID=UPI002ACD9C08|nr:phospholipase A [Thiohalophilus sp.]MDZ7805436.1 phospholipase A [Thiohalophilus sp.]